MNFNVKFLFLNGMVESVFLEDKTMATSQVPSIFIKKTIEDSEYKLRGTAFIGCLPCITRGRFNKTFCALMPQNSWSKVGRRVQKLGVGC